MGFGGTGGWEQAAGAGASVLAWAPQQAGTETKLSVQVLCWPKNSFGFLSSFGKTQSFCPTRYFTGSAIPGRGEGCRVSQGGGRASVKVCHQADLCHLGTMYAQSCRNRGRKGKGLSTPPHQSPIAQRFTPFAGYWFTPPGIISF